MWRHSHDFVFHICNATTPQVSRGRRRGRTRRARRAPTHLDGAVGRRADDPEAVGGEKGVVHKRQVSRQLLHRLPRPELVYPEEESDSGAGQLHKQDAAQAGRR